MSHLKPLACPSLGRGTLIGIGTSQGWVDARCGESTISGTSAGSSQ